MHTFEDYEISPFQYSWIMILVILITLGCDSSQNPLTSTGIDRSYANATISHGSVEKIERFCGDCHPFPSPLTFAKSDWAEEVRKGFGFYSDSRRTDLEEPTRQDTIRYFRGLAPDQVVVPRADSFLVVDSPVSFVRGPLVSTSQDPPSTAHVVWDARSKSLYFTDMKYGGLWNWKPELEGAAKGLRGESKLIYQGRNTCRVNLCDWNHDGATDFLVGELGSYQIGDHSNGRVSLLIADGNGSINAIVLAEGLGRVVSAVPFDYEEDGDLDVLVSEFGLQKTGALRLLRNVGGDLNSPKFNSEVLDPRHGVLGAEVADLDGDGHLDFVVAYGQEFETVEAHMNEGEGKYSVVIVHKMPDPSYNSSSFQIVDLDQDGKLDIVHTCGDIMDTNIAKPYYGLRWLRNLGQRRWENRELGLLVGALQSTVADFDGDGDLDVAGVGFFPGSFDSKKGTYDSICWWEQRKELEFVRHSIEQDHCFHATCTSADLDMDGRVDLIVGEWPNDNVTGAFRIIWNQKVVQ